MLLSLLLLSSFLLLLLLLLLFLYFFCFVFSSSLVHSFFWLSLTPFNLFSSLSLYLSISFQYAVLPSAKETTDSEEDDLMDIVQAQYMWWPHHHGTTPKDCKTFFIVIDNDELDAYVKSNYNTIKSATWKNFPRVHQHIHLFEGAQTSLDYMFAVVTSTRGGATGQVPYSKRLQLGLNLIPDMALGEGLVA